MLVLIQFLYSRFAIKIKKHFKWGKYDKPDNIDNDDETPANAYNDWLGFAILKCRILNCQHVIRLSAAKQVGNNWRCHIEAEILCEDKNLKK